MTAFDPGRYPLYANLTAQLQAWASEYPDLCQVSEIGRSAGGRSVWAVTLTNRHSGDHGDKPDKDRLGASKHGAVSSRPAKAVAVRLILG